MRRGENGFDPQALDDICGVVLKLKQPSEYDWLAFD
jgi:hypothetical protein